MSWIEFLGETWGTTDDEAELHLHLWTPLAHCPRRSWSISLSHYEFDPSKDQRKMNRWLDFEIGNLHFHEPDWHRLAGLEIRADADWHARHEHFQEHGHLESSAMHVRATYLGGSLGNPSPTGEGQSWKGHDFTLKFGQRDGLYFPCEIDAWLMPEEEYALAAPESPAQLRRFGEGPPDLRIITCAKFHRGNVLVPRSDDPLTLAREYLRDQIALEEIHEPQIEWAIRRKFGSKPGSHETEPMPGWTSTVKFQTEPMPKLVP